MKSDPMCMYSTEDFHPIKTEESENKSKGLTANQIVQKTLEKSVLDFGAKDYFESKVRFQMIQLGLINEKSNHQKQSNKNKIINKVLKNHLSVQEDMIDTEPMIKLKTTNDDSYKDLLKSLFYIYPAQKTSINQQWKQRMMKFGNKRKKLIN